MAEKNKKDRERLSVDLDAHPDVRDALLNAESAMGYGRTEMVIEALRRNAGRTNRGGSRPPQRHRAHLHDLWPEGAAVGHRGVQPISEDAGRGVVELVKAGERDQIAGVIASPQEIDENIQALLERLYDARREIQVNQSERPVFVLIANGPEHRSMIEDAFFKYFARKYGIEGTHLSRIAEREYAKNFTRLEFGEYGFSVMLMDW